MQDDPHDPNVLPEEPSNLRANAWITRIYNRYADPAENYARKFFVVLGVLALMTGTVIAGNAIYDAAFGWTTTTYDEDGNEIFEGEDESTCNVLGINLHGMMLTYIPENDEEGTYDDAVGSEDVIGFIRGADKDANIKAILLEVDSGGGLPVTGEEIANALRSAKKPTVALIRQMATSAAYWAASGAEHVIGSLNSDIGSIGVNASYLQAIGNNKKNGYEYVQLVAGKYKDMLDPDKPLTTDERDIITRDINIIHKNFISAISINRGMSMAEVTAIADGSSVLGAKAKELGLIDQIGGIEEVNDYLEKEIGEPADICWE